MRSVVTFAGLSLVAAIVVPHMSAQIHAPPVAPAFMAARPTVQVTPTSSYSRSVVVPRGRNGNFEVEASVDGRRMNFMIDTGASVIALTARDAAMLGIHPAANEFVALVKTANGMARAAPTQLSMIEIEDLVVRDVDAMVMPDGALGDNLLGLSYLSRLRRFEYSSGRLVLEQ